MLERRTVLKGVLAALAAPVGVALAKVLPKGKLPGPPLQLDLDTGPFVEAMRDADLQWVQWHVTGTGTSGDLPTLTYNGCTPELLDDDVGMDPVLREKLKEEWYRRYPG